MHINKEGKKVINNYLKGLIKLIKGISVTFCGAWQGLLGRC